jgi:hypothetical protein
LANLVEENAPSEWFRCGSVTIHRDGMERLTTTRNGYYEVFERQIVNKNTVTTGTNLLRGGLELEP